jgi:hypothetical protein
LKQLRCRSILSELVLSVILQSQVDSHQLVPTQRVGLGGRSSNAIQVFGGRAEAAMRYDLHPLLSYASFEGLLEEWNTTADQGDLSLLSIETFQCFRLGLAEALK